MVRHLEILPRVDYRDSGEPVAGEQPVIRPLAGAAVSMKPEEPEPAAGVATQRPRRFASAASEHKRVNATHGRSHGGNAGTQAVQVDAVSELGAMVAARDPLDHLPEVRSTGQCDQSRAALESIFDLVDIHAAVAEDEGYHPRVD